MYVVCMYICVHLCLYVSIYAVFQLCSYVCVWYVLAPELADYDPLTGLAEPDKGCEGMLQACYVYTPIQSYIHVHINTHNTHTILPYYHTLHSLGMLKGYQKDCLWVKEDTQTEIN